MSKQDIQERTFNFSVRIVKLCKYLREKGGTGYDLSKQLIRSGPSVGANVEEARETKYWLRLLIATEENL